MSEVTWKVPDQYATFTSRVAYRAFLTAIICLCLIAVLQFCFEVRLLPMLDERGHGDSYVLFDVLHYLRTGTVYRDLSRPPFLAAQYSPAVYLMYGEAARLMGGLNPFLGPRVLALGLFGACLLVSASIVSVLLPRRRAWLWGVLFCCTISGISQWVMQIRGDFAGILFSLLALRLLMSRFRHAVMVAGISAGFALQFKITFVSAAAAGMLWLLISRQWRHACLFVTGATLSSIGLYYLYSLREPRMLEQLFALSPGIPEIRGWITLLIAGISNIVALLALAGILSLHRMLDRRWVLLFLYTFFATGVAASTSLQAGAGANYYFEPLFGMSAFAVLGFLAVSEEARRTSALPTLGAILILISEIIPRGRELKTSVAIVNAAEQNAEFMHASDLLRGMTIFSTVPRVAVMDSLTPLTEPYLLTYMTLLKKFNPGSLFMRIRSGEFDAVVTSTSTQEWRGIPFISPEMHEAITTGYQPACQLNHWLIHLRRGDSLSALRLLQSGCKALAPMDAGDWWSPRAMK